VTSRAETGGDVALVIGLRPGLAALSGVMSVLHARLADVGGMSYTSSGGVARLHVELGGTRPQAQRLAAQVGRRVDVLSVVVMGAGAAVGPQASVDESADGSDRVA
jgi:hypothetical protein